MMYVREKLVELIGETIELYPSEREDIAEEFKAIMKDYFGLEE